MPLQHNPEQKDAPEIPPEVLNKIASIAKVLGLNDSALMPQAEPHCNCMFCQITRSLQGATSQPAITDAEETISEADLHFRSWDIKEISERLYQVSNPLDPQEQYQVFLGEPLGCTCGEKNCAHIQAVLRS